MLKRILMALGGDQKPSGPLEWAKLIAKSHQAGVSTMPLIDSNAWKNILPVMITASRAARVLEDEPWDQPKDAQHRLQEMCCGSLSELGIPCTTLPADGDPLGALARHSRYYDLLVFALGKGYSPKVVPDFTKAVSRLILHGACPLFLVPPETREVKRVLVAYSGTIASARSFRRFIQSDLFKDAQINLVSLGESLDEAGALLAEASAYLDAHGRKVHLTALRGKESAIVEHAFSSDIDLIVAGSNHRNALGIETSSVTLRAFLSQNKVPVFISH
jgi:nucleotide-binding universal stress UspA family protein